MTEILHKIMNWITKIEINRNFVKLLIYEYMHSHFAVRCTTSHATVQDCIQLCVK